MVINSIWTVQLKNIHAPIALNQTRSRSVPVVISKKPPDRSRRERKKPHDYPQFPLDKPIFINFASAYINPYRDLTPIIINHDPRRRVRRRKRSKRKHGVQDLPEESLNEESSFSQQISQSTDPIDLWPSDSNAFDMDLIRQRQIALDNTVYRETIDAWKPSSLNHLVTLLKELTVNTNIINQSWVIFYWISQNILYDIDVDVINHRSDDIFRSGKTSYEGYATIFKSLCDHMGIKCQKIPGYAKDAHYQINQPLFPYPNHTWNAVQLTDNHWYLIDSVWGSGYVDNKYKYKKDLNTYYFLTRPESMIYNHFPKDAQWQLLAKPITMFDYFRLPYLHSYYFLHDLTLISPRFSSLVTFDPNESFAEVLIQAPDDVRLTCSIKNDQKSTTLTQYDASRQLWQCLFAPSKANFHTWVIFANRLSSSNQFTNVIELGVEVSTKDFLRQKLLPVTFGKFIEHKCQIISPMDGVLKRGSQVTVHCRIPNACCARILSDGTWLEEIVVKDQIFKQQITVPERELIVYAQFYQKKSTNLYHGLLEYSVAKK